MAALQSLYCVVPILGEHLAAVTTNMTPLLAGNLASKNATICQTSQDILDSIMKFVGKYRMNSYLNGVVSILYFVSRGE